MDCFTSSCPTMRLFKLGASSMAIIRAPRLFLESPDMSEANNHGQVGCVTRANTTPVPGRTANFQTTR